MLIKESAIPEGSKIVYLCKVAKAGAFCPQCEVSPICIYLECKYTLNKANARDVDYERVFEYDGDSGDYYTEIDIKEIGE